MSSTSAEIYNQGEEMTKRYDIDPDWAAWHSRDVRTDSRTLPPAAFPSLPLDPQAPHSTPDEPLENFAEDDVFSDEEDDPTSPMSTGEELGSLEFNRISHVDRMAIVYHCQDRLPEDPDMADRVLERHSEMDQAEFFKDPDEKPKRKRRRTDYSKEEARITSLEERKDRYLHKLRRAERKIHRAQASPGIAPPEGFAPSKGYARPEVPPTSPSSDESIDYRRKAKDLKEEIRWFDYQTFKRKKYYKAVKANMKFRNWQPEPINPQLELLPTPLYKIPDEPPGWPILGNDLPEPTREDLNFIAEFHANMPSAAEFDAMLEEAQRDHADAVNEPQPYGGAAPADPLEPIFKRIEVMWAQRNPRRRGTKHTKPARVDEQMPFPGLDDETPATSVSGGSEFARLAGVKDETPTYWLNDDALVPAVLESTARGGVEEQMPLEWPDNEALDVPM